MEYSLLSKLSKKPYSPSNFIQLPKYPTNQFSTPGVGFTAKLYNFYVPIHGKTNALIDKKITEDSTKKESDTQQIGAGSYNIESEQTQNSVEGLNLKTDNTPPNVINDSMPENLKRHNEQKKSLVGEELFKSMLHPKIKVSKTVFESKHVAKKRPTFEIQKKKLGAKVTNKKSGSGHNFKII